MKVRRVLETAIYCDNLPETVQFYRELFEFPVMLDSERVVAFDAGEGTVLLLFQRGASRNPLPTFGGVVPGHSSDGPAHFAFAIDSTDVTSWVDRLSRFDVPIESRVRWTGGGESIYFRDPDGRSVELVTPGTWENY
jgi:catechol 2,3-dioxygenase-like lactoylglutathione lyase family enzyme